MLALCNQTVVCNYQKGIKAELGGLVHIYMHMHITTDERGLDLPEITCTLYHSFYNKVNNIQLYVPDQCGQ